jgi:ABC-type phosphate/phosphonate transport system substrate-binding protein
MSFPMYDLPGLQTANAELLRTLERLLRAQHVDADSASITQMCGYPLQTDYRGQYTLLGMPCYGVPGCDGPTHRSFIVVASTSSAVCLEDLRGGTFAVNSMDSNTGMNLPRHRLAPLARAKRFFDRLHLTGSHRASMEAVANGQADAAAIDCVTFGLHAELEPGTIAGLRVLDRTSVSPSIPFVVPRTTAESTVAAMRRALEHFSARAEFAALRQALRIERVDAACESDYDKLLNYRAEAVALGYPNLA